MPDRHGSDRTGEGGQSRAGRLVSLCCWCLLSWALLTRTVTVEDAVYGLGVAVGVGLALSALGGRVVGPWALCWPPRLGRVLVLIGDTVARVVRANLKLALAAWRPGGGQDTGVVAVPTRTRSEGEILLVGLLTSLIVDSQVVDVKPETNTLLFHAIGVPDESRRTAAINAPVEARILAVTRGRHE